jgi:hypothetical protein
MAVTKSILQNVRQQSVIKFINDGIAATSNVTLLELKMPDETFLGEVACNVNIQTVMFAATDSLISPIVIGRGPTAFSISNVMYLHGSDSFELDQGAGFHDQTLNQANLTISMPPYSMLYLVLGKASGYLEPDFQSNSRLRGV